MEKVGHVTTDCKGSIIHGILKLNWLESTLVAMW